MVALKFQVWHARCRWQRLRQGSGQTQADKEGKVANRSLLAGAILACLLTGFTTSASAQATVAEVTGTITDPSGSAVPQVDVVLTEVSTNFKAALKSNDQGVYYTRLAPGTYNISASVAGFKTFAANGVLVPTGQLLRYD